MGHSSCPTRRVVNDKSLAVQLCLNPCAVFVCRGGSPSPPSARARAARSWRFRTSCRSTRFWTRRLRYASSRYLQLAAVWVSAVWEWMLAKGLGYQAASSKEGEPLHSVLRCDMQPSWTWTIAPRKTIFLCIITGRCPRQCLPA